MTETWECWVRVRLLLPCPWSHICDAPVLAPGQAETFMMGRWGRPGLAR